MAININGTGSITGLSSLSSPTISGGSLPTGSASAPGLVFSGDSNTGIYSPGADQVAISTNGTGRLFVDASGNVGVNATSPASTLDITTPSTGGGIRIGAPNFPYVSLSQVAGSAASIFGGGVIATGLDQITKTVDNPGHFIRLGTTTGITFHTNVTGNAGTTALDTSAERLRITSDGKVGLGTSTPGGLFHVGPSGAGVVIDNTYSELSPPSSGNDSYVFRSSNDGSLNFSSRPGGGGRSYRFWRGSNVSMIIDDSGRVGIGASPSAKLHVNTGTNENLWVGSLGGSGAGVYLASVNDSGSANTPIQIGSASDIRLAISGTEAARVDSNRRLLVGTSSSISNVYVGGASYQSPLQVIGNAAGYGNGLTQINYSADGYGSVMSLGSSKNATIGSNGTLASGDDFAILNFIGNDGTNFRSGAYIIGTCDGTVSTGSVPGRLSFWTTATAASSPTERMRIDKAGQIIFGSAGTASGVSTGNTAWIDSGSAYYGAVAGNTVAYFNRNTNDGTIIEFRQENVVEGTISVSGTTVSYNGAHLSRWSQLPGGAERTEILRGTVLSNIDEMCAWDEEDNEQLNRMQVSDVEGDPNVSGVFQAWDNDDDTYTDDFYCAMTGDFIIRIAEGVTVQRGDLLMSAGDGTAKPQDDDIIRSKTIAKVTSTHVTCTYDDGSYCVPCVLMAC
jgi:hypothetical protein